jgi:Txe/YoeB family toxin of Txe-Axe toxin-antitoxin module
LNKKYILFLLSTAILAFVLGFCFGATDYHESFKGVPWTNIVSTVTTLSGFLLAFTTYYQWLSNKKRDDAYLVAKNYLSALNEIREILRELNFQYWHLCPSPGQLVEQKETYSKRIEHVSNLSHSLYLARVNLNQAKSELTFWKVRLSDSFEEKHNFFNKDLTNIGVVMTGFNSQLYHYHVKDNENIGEVLSHKEMYDSYVNSVTSVLDERVLLGFEKVFKFE